MDAANLAQRMQETKGKLHACRSALETSRQRTAGLENEERALLADLETQEADMALQFQAIRGVGLAKLDPADGAVKFSEDGRVRAVWSAERGIWEDDRLFGEQVAAE